MHGKSMRYLLVAAAALVAGLLLAGTPVQALLPFLFLLACPLMMVMMMRGMGGHDGAHSQNPVPPEIDDGALPRAGESPRRIAGRP